LIRQFINSSIKRLSPSAPIVLAVVTLAAGCGGPRFGAVGLVVAPRLGRAYVLAGLSGPARSPAGSWAVTQAGSASRRSLRAR